MNAKSATDAYLRETIETAPPIKIVRLLYQGALRSIAQAIDAGPTSASFCERVVHADQIVTELRLALRPEFAPEQCEKLEGLYHFVEGRLLEALREQATEPLAQARGILERLFQAWNQVEIEAVSER